MLWLGRYVNRRSTRASGMSIQPFYCENANVRKISYELCTAIGLMIDKKVLFSTKLGYEGIVDQLTGSGKGTLNLVLNCSL